MGAAAVPAPGKHSFIYLPALHFVNSTAFPRAIMAEDASSNKRKAEEISEATGEVEIDPATGNIDNRTPVTVLTGFLGSGKVPIGARLLSRRRPSCARPPGLNHSAAHPTRRPRC